MAGPPPHSLAAEYFAGTAIECVYPDAVQQLQLEWQRLACNLLILAGEALPRGGRIVLAAARDAIAVEVDGEGVGLSAANGAALALTTPLDALSSREVGAYFAGLLAESLGQRLQITAEPGRLRISCEAVG